MIKQLCSILVLTYRAKSGAPGHGARVLSWRCGACLSGPAVGCSHSRQNVLSLVPGTMQGRAQAS